MAFEPAILVEHFRYHQWASDELMRAARELPDDELYRDRHSSHGGIFGTLCHIYLADQVWLARLRGDAQVAYGEAPPSIEALASAWRPVQEGLIAWAEVQAPNWDRVLSIRRMNGELLESPLWEVALHLVNHGTLHRGQAMAMLRQMGRTPPTTDLLLYRRAHPRPSAAGVAP